ncbi:phytoene/squalene synthase family protein [Ensifer soli]|uniref:phytoene/squalene synthase family protein n=1 Tax=Ciceribacter sp. sgz301302 TaxID=3342379 RepID=UPI0035B9D709
MTGASLPSADAGDCLATLRDTDRDRYLACLLAPPQARPALAALYAFHAEIARVRDLAREALPGEIRLQWWRDVLAGASPEARSGHPVADQLLDAINAHDLPVPVLEAMIDARIFDLYDDPMEDRTALEGYAGETTSALIQLACLVLDPAAAARSATAAGHAGVAQAIAGLLLLLPRHRARGQVYLPGDLLRATGLDRDTFLAGAPRAAVDAAIRAFVSLGREHLEKARRAAETISAGNIPAFLGVSLCEPVFRQAERAGTAQMLAPPSPPAQWRRQWRMWRTLRTGRF